MKKSLILSFGAVCILGTAQAVAVNTKSKSEATQWWNDPAPAPAPAPAFAPAPTPASDSSSSSPAFPAADNTWDDFSWDAGTDDTTEDNNSSIEADIAASLSLD